MIRNIFWVRVDGESRGMVEYNWCFVFVCFVWIFIKDIEYGINRSVR